MAQKERTLEEYDNESVLGWNFYREELNTLRLLGITTIGQLLRRLPELKDKCIRIDHDDAFWKFVNSEHERLLK